MRILKPHSGQRILAILAFVLVLGLSAKESQAYFTTYVTAQGSKQLHLGWQTELHEEYENWEKIIQVENIGDVECYVRIKVLAGKLVTLTPSGDSWVDGGDGYWYYTKILPPRTGESSSGTEENPSMTDVFRVHIDHEKASATDLNVVVIQECAPVLYDDDGNPLPPTDKTVWSQKFEVKQ